MGHASTCSSAWPRRRTPASSRAPSRPTRRPSFRLSSILAWTSPGSFSLPTINRLRPSPSRAAVTGWRPGRMTVTLDPVPPHPSYLLVAENWYPDWQATVDGGPAHVLRGDYSLLTVALPAGAKVVDLTFRSKLYELGRTLTLASLAVLLIALLAALTLPRRAPHG